MSVSQDLKEIVQFRYSEVVEGTARLMIELSSSDLIPGVENLLSVNVLAFK